MYIRNLRKPSPNKNIYKFASSKNRKTVMCEGSLERDCCYHFEYDNDVVSFEAQPLGYYYEYHGKILPYTPDFLVRYSDGSYQYIEIKPLGKALSKDFKAQFAARKFAARKLGFDIILVTNKQIRQGHFLGNSELVHRYSGCISGDGLSTVVLGHLSTFKSITISGLSSVLRLPISKVFSAVLKLVSLGKAWVDLDSAKLDENTLVVVN